MGFKDSIITNIAGQIGEAIDKQVNGKEIVQKLKADLVQKKIPAGTLKRLCEGPIFNITCEMQEGLWTDQKSLAAEYRRRANQLDPTSQAKKA